MIHRDSEGCKLMTRFLFRHAALPAALLLMARHAGAQDIYLTHDATIKSKVNGGIEVGFATESDYKNLRHPASPTVSLVNGAILLKRLAVRNHSTVNMRGGSIAGTVAAGETGVINISGGSIEGNVSAFDNSTINIRGGKIAGDLRASKNGTLNLFGTGLSKTVNIKGAFFCEYTLSGKLQDGTSLSGKIATVEYGNGAKLNLVNAATPPAKPQDAAPPPTAPERTVPIEKSRIKS